MSQKQKSGGLDIFRIIAALLVISIHTSPFSGISENFDFFVTRIVARVAVPFFFHGYRTVHSVGFLQSK